MDKVGGHRISLTSFDGSTYQLLNFVINQVCIQQSSCEMIQVLLKVFVYVNGCGILASLPIFWFSLCFNL